MDVGTFALAVAEGAELLVLVGTGDEGGVVDFARVAEERVRVDCGADVRVIEPVARDLAEREGGLQLDHALEVERAGRGGELLGEADVEHVDLAPALVDGVLEEVDDALAIGQVVREREVRQVFRLAEVLGEGVDVARRHGGRVRVERTRFVAVE